MALVPYLDFNGNAREVIDFYVSVFDIHNPRIMTFGEMPGNEAFPMEEDLKKRIMHAELDFAGGTLMFSDTQIKEPVTFGENVTLLLSSPDKADIERWFTRLSDQALVTQPLQETFFAPYYGALKDKFGIVWQFLYEPVQT